MYKIKTKISTFENTQTTIIIYIIGIILTLKKYLLKVTKHNIKKLINIFLYKDRLVSYAQTVIFKIDNDKYTILAKI